MLVDSSPLIYLAKIDALDAFAASGYTPLVTPEVERETARPGLAYEHPDSLLIAEAIRSGVLARTELTKREAKEAERLLRETGGIGRAEAEVLAAATERSMPVLLSERRASRLAGALGIDARTPVDLLFAGTPNRALLADRVSRFAQLVEMRLADVQELMNRIEARER